MAFTEIRIGIAVANLHDADLRNEIANYIEAQAPDTIRSTIVPGRSGVRGAAFDYWGTLSKISDIAQVGGLLWTIYVKFIAPAKARAPNAGVYIVTPFPNHKAEYWLGKTHLNQAEFLREFEKGLAPLLIAPKKARRRKAPGNLRRGKSK